MIERIGVLIPARDEEARIETCLESVREAARRVPIPVSIVVAADGCRDRTAALADALGARVVEILASGVGAARAAAAEVAIADGCQWLANTDADTIVPANWLETHVTLAERGIDPGENRGADVVLGTVRPDFAELTPAQWRAWEQTHRHQEDLGSIHGANLGIRASSYLAVGGFRPLLEHEDVDIVDRLRHFRVVATADCEAVTSGRTHGRTPGGFARYLREDLLIANDASGAVA